MKRYTIKFGKKILGIITRISPTFSARLIYMVNLGSLPNLKNPKSFAEKLTWLKLYRYANDSQVSALADKYEVRQYIESKGCAHILNELYGVYDNVHDLDFNSLPVRFALKGTHGCAYNIIVNDKSSLDIKSVKREATAWLQEQYGYASAELHYTKIRPRLVVEKNIADNNGAVPLEYKIFCFNGKVKVIQLSSDPKDTVKRNYFDTDWNELLYAKSVYRQDKPMSKPKKLDDMITIAEKLSDGFPFVRVDLYADDNQVIFGELTFSPAAGCPPILSTKGQEDMGDLINLSDQLYNTEVLVSTMNLLDSDRLIKDMRIAGRATIVNQITDSSISEINIKKGQHRTCSYREKGLSRSRNRAIAVSNADICVIADDDMYYVSDYERIIKDAYIRYPDADIISFYVDHEDSRSMRRLKEGRVSLLESMRISSVNITFRKQSIVDSGVIFNEQFGAGTANYMGEENIFLADCIRAGLKLYAVPIKIATLRESASTWFRGYDKEYLMIKGKVYRTMFPVLFPSLILRFAMRKRRLYKSNMSLVSAIAYMFKGALSISEPVNHRAKQGR